MRGRIILSPVLQVARIAASIPQVEPLTKNHVLSAPKASAANSWAARITLSGLNKLSNSANSVKSARKTSLPIKSVKNGEMPAPRLCPGV